jgi:hypothetical protein
MELEGLEGLEGCIMPPSTSSITSSTLSDTDNSRTFSPESEVAGGADSSLEREIWRKPLND